jgi:uncharacterized membrane protein YadS
MNKNIFFVGLILAASRLFSPPIALLGGLVYGFTMTHPFHVESKCLAKFLLQASVVALGFGMNLHEVVYAGRSGFLCTAVSITVAMLLGLGLGSLIQVGKKPAFLISAGTAICGGSAIAAVGPIAEANEEEMAVALGSVFILNSVALFLFPVIEYLLHMSQTSLDSGPRWRFMTPVRLLARRRSMGRRHWLWAPRPSWPRALDRSFVFCNGGHAEVKGPHSWFILVFCLATLLNTLLPTFRRAFVSLNQFGKSGLTVTLFLIGTVLNRQTLQRVGFRPLLQGLALWIVVGTSTLALILLNWIHV